MTTKMTCSKCLAHFDGSKAIIELCELHAAAGLLKAAVYSAVRILNRHNPHTGFNLAAESSELTAIVTALTMAHVVACGTDSLRPMALKNLDELDAVGIDRKWRECQEMYAHRRQCRQEAK